MNALRTVPNTENNPILRRPPSRALDATEALDLRRLQRQQILDTVVSRVDGLAPTDRQLLLAVYRDGMAVENIARAACSAIGTQAVLTTARALRRRVKHLVRRILTPKYAFVLLRCPEWPASRRRIARACVLEGLSMRRASAELGVSLHLVRRELAAIHALFIELQEHPGQRPRLTQS